MDEILYTRNDAERGEIAIVFGGEVLRTGGVLFRVSVHITAPETPAHVLELAHGISSAPKKRRAYPA